PVVRTRHVSIAIRRGFNPVYRWLADRVITSGEAIRRLVVEVVVALAGGLGAASHFMKEDLFPVTVGAALPDFRAKVLGENRYKSFADYKGKVVLLNVWGTFCPPCIVEMPSLERLHKAYGDSGLKLVAVSIDDAVSEDSIRAFAKNLGVTFEILHDPTHEIERVLQVTGYPETFVVGPEGTIRRKVIGPDDWSSQGNRALMAQLLGLEIPKIVADTAPR
ncbi:MAG: TlpA family protein disulfide reductase, partial [bacterium]